MSPTPKAKILSLALAVAALPALGLWVATGCSSTTAYADPCPDADDSLTIGGYCQEILPAMCAYSINTCGTGGSVEQCVANALPTCCQGTCGRNVCPVDPAVLQTCVQAYAGPDAGLTESTDASVTDAGEAPDAGLSCTAIAIGLAPLACQSIVTLR